MNNFNNSQGYSREVGEFHPPVYDRTIRISVTSNGLSGKNWLAHLGNKGIQMGEEAEKLLLSDKFIPTKGIIYQIAILTFLDEKNRLPNNIRRVAASRNFLAPPAEVACLIRDKYTDKALKDLKLRSILTMHEPIKDERGVPWILNASPDHSNEGSWIFATYEGPGSLWPYECGFAFLDPKFRPGY